MRLILPDRHLSRRKLLQWSGVAGSSLLLNACGSSWGSTEVGIVTEPFNQTIQSLMVSQKPIPEFSVSQIEPQALLINSFDITPTIDPKTFSLSISGEVQQPLALSLADIQSMPLTSMIISHVCVEGWSAIVQWGGIRLRDLIMLAQPKAGVRYVYFKSADGYYESWDLASAVHPQTLLAYQKNGEPLPIENGAPLRLASPIKLGYKQSKWVTEVRLLKDLPADRGYWVNQGYEWFAGL
ncbi:molybdopterin-dependent oxidoreductase [Alkalinema pantanalense CENA528]|uniref:molybdopterin-dependent oxidoreductase n=1 Tax=Alkalinema pantanalense TaxID=1620705 RepID=UPI003D6E7044